MKTIKKLIVTLIALTAIAGFVSAEDKMLTDKVYVGADIGMLFFKQDIVDGGGEEASFSMPVLQGRAGYILSKHFAFEGRVMTALSDDEDTVGSGATAGRLALDWDYTLALYLKGRLPLGEKASIYVLAGIAHSKISLSVKSGPYVGGGSDSGTDFSFGLGADYDISDSWEIGAEWAWLHNAFNKSEGTAGQVTAGLTYTF